MTTVQIGPMVFPERAGWGWFFNELVGWDSLSDNKASVTERPRGHGAFAASRSFRSALPLTVSVGFIGSQHEDLLTARMQLAALGAEGPVPMKVINELGTFIREVTIQHIDQPDQHGRVALGRISIDMLARDPLRYSLPQVDTAELPTAGTGLVWPITYPIDWGQPGSGGKISLTNKGTAPAAPVFRVAGGLSSVTITEAGSGNRLTLDRVIPAGSVAEFDGRSRRVTLDGSTDVSATFLTRREWMTIPHGETASYLFSGTSTGGSPTLSGELQSAWW